jgi:hypothetical protein
MLQMTQKSDPNLPISDPKGVMALGGRRKYRLPHQLASALQTFQTDKHTINEQWDLNKLAVLPLHLLTWRLCRALPATAACHGWFMPLLHTSTADVPPMRISC